MKRVTIIAGYEKLLGVFIFLIIQLLEVLNYEL
jgi:hypothetical protein